MIDPLQQRIVPFYGDDLVAVQQPDGTIFVLFVRLCENLGLNQQAQARRIQRHAVLQKALVNLNVQTLGGVQTLQCLKLSLLPLPCTYGRGPLRMGYAWVTPGDTGRRVTRCVTLGLGQQDAEKRMWVTE